MLAAGFGLGLLALVGCVLIAVGAYAIGRAAGYRDAWNQRAADKAAGRPVDPTIVST